MLTTLDRFDRPATDYIVDQRGVQLPDRPTGPVDRRVDRRRYLIGNCDAA
jgi:hypothetical protein